MGDRSMRKGISPIIATVLLILIAIATGIVIYAFATGWIGGRISETAGPQAILVVEAGFNSSAGSTKVFTLYVRNDGGTPANITRAYVTDPNGNVYLESLVDSSGSTISGVVINPGEVKPVNVSQSGINVQAGYSYKIKLVSTDGSEVVYVVKA